MDSYFVHPSWRNMMINRALNIIKCYIYNVITPALVPAPHEWQLVAASPTCR